MLAKAVKYAAIAMSSPTKYVKAVKCAAIASLACQALLRFFHVLDLFSVPVIVW